MRRSIAMFVVGGLLASASGVSAEDGVLEAAERAVVAASAAAGAALQDDEGQRRSMGRTWGGVGLILAGAVLAGHRIEHTRCSGSPWTCESWTDRPGIGIGSAGIGVAALGVLLATVWSDVPVAGSVDVSVTPDRFQIGKTFGF